MYHFGLHCVLALNKNSSFAIPRVSQPLKIRYAVPHYVCSHNGTSFIHYRIQRENILFFSFQKFQYRKFTHNICKQLQFFKPIFFLFQMRNKEIKDSLPKRLAIDRMKKQPQIPSFFSSKYLMIFFHGFAAPFRRSPF